MKVITKVPAKSYYGSIEIPSGMVGIIGAEKVACVRLRKTCKCQTFVCVDFSNGTRAAYHEHEIQRVAEEVI